MAFGASAIIDPEGCHSDMPNGLDAYIVCSFLCGMGRRFESKEVSRIAKSLRSLHTTG